MNVLVCKTPLQTLIANKIIDHYPNERFILIMILSHFNDKNIYYFNKLKNRVEHAILIDDTSYSRNKFIFLLELIFFKNPISGLKIKRFFLANTTSLYAQIILTESNIEEIYTFDDGLANIIDKSPLLSESRSIKNSIVNFLIKNNYSPKKIVDRSICHYTIYPNIKNIIDKTYPIKLWSDFSTNKSCRSTRVLKILLGQPIFTDANRNALLIRKTCSKFGIDKYFPHPLETYSISDIEYIESPLIFEEYILDKIIKDSKVIVYTYFSSVALNIYSMPNVEIRIIKVNSIDNTTSINESYELFKRIGLDVWSEIEA